MGVLAWFRLQERYQRTLGRLLPKLSTSNNFTQFTSLLEASMFDEAGISYSCPITYTQRSPQGGRSKGHSRNSRLRRRSQLTARLGFRPPPGRFGGVIRVASGVMPGPG